MDEFGGNLFFYLHPMDMIYHLFIKRMVRVSVVAGICGFGYIGYKIAKHEIHERDEDTLNTITREVQQVINKSYPIESRLVTNRRDIADLPNYRHAICCVSNAPRIISFNDHGKLEPDADLGFRAFDKMERSADPYDHTSPYNRGYIIQLK
uniref:Uncharacterized protein n=1 Tax=Branchiostoma floridae TaxID=7739 RepID=C3YVV5_BRAFL|eukprot:XP_002599627.1 hypothetical protein BRAFLDRAFT_102575 [Branchiostoma floridae]